jgi:hypothetical protein
MDDDRDFCGQESVDILYEPVAPDKSFSSHFDLSVPPRSSLDSELTDIVIQDIGDFSTALPHVQAIESHNPQKVADSQIQLRFTTTSKIFNTICASLLFLLSLP